MLSLNPTPLSILSSTILHILLHHVKTQQHRSAHGVTPSSDSESAHLVTSCPDWEKQPCTSCDIMLQLSSTSLHMFGHQIQTQLLKSAHVVISCLDSTAKVCNSCDTVYRLSNTSLHMLWRHLQNEQHIVISCPDSAAKFCTCCVTISRMSNTTLNILWYHF